MSKMSLQPHGRGKFLCEGNFRWKLADRRRIEHYFPFHLYPTFFLWKFNMAYIEFPPDFLSRQCPTDTNTPTLLHQGCYIKCLQVCLGILCNMYLGPTGVPGRSGTQYNCLHNPLFFSILLVSDIERHCATYSAVTTAWEIAPTARSKKKGSPSPTPWK